MREQFSRDIILEENSERFSVRKLRANWFCESILFLGNCFSNESSNILRKRKSKNFILAFNNQQTKRKSWLYLRKALLFMKGTHFSFIMLQIFLSIISLFLYILLLLQEGTDKRQLKNPVYLLFHCKGIKNVFYDEITEIRKYNNFLIRHNHKRNWKIMMQTGTKRKRSLHHPCCHVKVQFDYL